MCSFHLYWSSLQWPQTASAGAETVISVAKLFHSCIVCQNDLLFALFEYEVYTGSVLSATRQASQQSQPRLTVLISGKTHAVNGKWSDTKMKACDRVWVGDHGHLDHCLSHWNGHRCTDSVSMTCFLQKGKETFILYLKINVELIKASFARSTLGSICIQIVCDV